MEEIWKDIKDYEGLYQVSNLGRVKSLERYVNCRNGVRMVYERLLKLHTTFGYYLAILSKNCITKTFRVNRLVAEAFIPNPHNYPTVDHINRDRANNCVDNLRWASYKLQAKNRTEIIRINRKDQSKPVIQYTKDMVFVMEYASIKEAERQTGINNGHISKCCRGERKSAGGFKWSYA